jgi:huntingtin interacting protein 1
MDFTKLTLHQTKRLEMNAQIKVLELETQLKAEQDKLYKLRKQHYLLDPELAENASQA